MEMKLTKEFVNSCRKVGVLRDFLCQAIDQVDEKDKEIAELKEERRWRNVDDKFPTADEGYILVLWEDGLPDIGYIGAEDDVIETVRDRGEGHSVDWWMPLPLSPKEEK